MEWKTVDGQKGLILDGAWYCEGLIFQAVRILEDDVIRLRSSLAAHQLESWTREWRMERTILTLCEIKADQGSDVQLLRTVLTPILRHADAPDTAPPLRLSVQDCRKIRESI